jgi:mannose-6-phosphate isomerase-like protein (cupin superfamily)
VKPLLLAFALAGTTAFGASVQRHRQPPMSKHPVGSDVVDRIGPEEIQDIRNNVEPDSRGAILPQSVDGRAQYILNFRRSESETERHDEWDDIVIVQHGYGQLDYGHSIKGGKKYATGEWRGGAITGEVTTLDLAPGVVIRVPAKTPHVIRSLSSSPLVYLTLKEKVAVAAAP